MDLSPYQLEMQSIPDRVEEALKLGVREDISFPLAEASRILEPGHVPIEDGVIRNPDGTLTVCCRTEMPGVTADMIDWWFCWHTIETQRYQLWHPLAHKKAFVKEDRTYLAGKKEGYIGLSSYVEEFIGEEMNKLIISFKEPEVIGLDTAKFREAKVGTAICARGGLQEEPIDSGWLIHMIGETDYGVDMISRFWLGNVKLRIPLLGRLLHKKVNSRKSRLEKVPDRFGIDLLRHCSEEMNHLARFLPQLYQEYRK
jgi:hypothetical protein